MTDTPVLIVGAGLTGLSCAYHLDKDHPYRLVERDDGVGGLARSRKRQNDFLCDGTGHWLHLRNEQARNLVERLLGDNLKQHQRRARVFSHGVFTDFPFQANTFGLPREVIAECLLGFIRARDEAGKAAAKNYLEWIQGAFGHGICKHFMEPYNRKIYGVPLETLASNFAAQYIPRPNLESVVKGALGLSAEALGYNASFIYPAKGGIGALSAAFHDALPKRAELQRNVIAVDLQKRAARFEDGEVVEFSFVVNTGPLPHFVNACRYGNSEVPSAVVAASERLKANTVLYFDVGVRGEPESHQDFHWIYLPEASFPFYRVGSYSAVERSLAPPGYRSYYVEFGRCGSFDPRKLEEPLLCGLKRLGIVRHERDVVFLEPSIISPAYVLFDDEYEAARKEILGWLESQRVISVGRYGRWQYNAMEDAMLEGKEAANTLRGWRK